MKKNYTLLNYFGSFLLLLCCSSVHAQDIHFSQFWNTPIDISPALVGVAKEDIRIFGAYKNQWASVPVGYNTFAAAVDAKLVPKGSRNGYFGVGLLLNNDEAGDGDWTLTDFSGLISYTQQLGTGIFASVGGRIGVGHRSFKLQNLTFDNQFNGEFFDPTIAPSENFVNTNTTFFDSSIGLNLHLQKNDQRTKLDIGAGIHHLNTPSQNFYAASTVDIPIRQDFYFMGVLKLSQKFDLLGNGLFRFQDEFQEIVFGSALRIHLNLTKTKELALDFGANLRLGDSVLPYVGLLYHQWRFGFTYDINTSPFTSATNFNGGPEFTAIYTITKPRATARKICPLF
ncbi:MAG: PorP/SprF family type IX secretion system membrane protein [Bacteroidota bacterium]